MREKHQYAGSTESTEMLYLVNSAIRMSHMDIEQRGDENLEAAENWFLRGMLRILWTDKVSICEVFRRAGVGKGLMQT